MRRNKGFTAKQSKRRSRQMEHAYIGTHNVRRSGSVQNLHRGSVYGERRESGQAVRYTGNRIQRRERTKSTGFIVLCAVILLAVAAAAGYFAFHAAVSGKLALADSSTAAVLAEETEGEPCYALFVADLTPADGDDGVDVLLLARIDKENKALSILNIPSNLRVTLTDGETHAIADAIGLGGDAALITAVQNATGLQANHFMRTDYSGFEKLVDELGGVQVTMEEDLDDPSAGTLYLSAGTYTLTGAQAAVYLMADNYADGAEARAKNQCAFAAAQAEALFSRAGFGFVFALDRLGGNVQTDWDSHDLVSLEDCFANFKASGILCGVTPGYEASKGTKYFVASSTEFAQVVTLFSQGQEPVVASSPSVGVDPGSFSILVKNGTGVTGEGKAVSELLTAQGFQVTDVQNADSTVYSETLIIYKDDALETAANAVKNALGFGRTVAAGSFYSFDEDILVICGGDRKVSSAG